MSQLLKFLIMNFKKTLKYQQFVLVSIKNNEVDATVLKTNHSISFKTDIESSVKGAKICNEKI